MQTTRQARAMANRHQHHQRRVERASTDRARLRAACGWLVAEAVRAGRAGEATRAVLGLVAALRDAPAVTVRDARLDPDLLPYPRSRGL